jgi:predicted nucleotidyltransferase component of viral defense system
MRSISAAQVKLITAAINEGKTAYPAGALEKDLHLTEILRILIRSSTKDLTLSFGGGTSLIKAFATMNRMSEDLDIKVTSIINVGKSELRRKLKALKRSIEGDLQTSGFEIVNSTILNEYRFFEFELKYQEEFPPEVSLRPVIKIEFTFAKLHIQAIQKPISTLIYRDLGMFHPPLDFSCVAVEQNTAEKILSFLRRWDPTASNNDSRLVRHLHDVAILMEAQIDRDGLRISFQEAVEEDRKRFANSQPEFMNNPKKLLEWALSQLQSDDSIAPAYQQFVLELVAGPAKSCEETLDIFIKTAVPLISGLQ